MESSLEISEAEPKVDINENGLKEETELIQESEIVIAKEIKVDTIENNEIVIAEENELDIVEDNEIVIAEERDVVIAEDNDVVIAEDNDVVIAEDNDVVITEDNDVVITEDNEGIIAEDNEVTIAEENEGIIAEDNDVVITEDDEGIIAEANEVDIAEESVVIIEENEVVLADEIEMDITEQNELKSSQETVSPILEIKARDPIFSSKTTLDNLDTELDFEDDKSEQMEHLAEESDGSGEIQEDGEASEQEDLEEGEVKESTALPVETSPAKGPTCKYFVKGNCHFGENCRYLHPGFVNNKGKYRMFEPPKYTPPRMAMRPPFIPFFRPPPFPMMPMHFPARPMIRPNFILAPSPSPTKEPPKESAWERGIKHAKERLKEASRRKEEEPDFEEKRLNLTFEDRESPAEEEEEELDKENFEKHTTNYSKYRKRQASEGSQSPPPLPTRGSDNDSMDEAEKYRWEFRMNKLQEHSKTHSSRKSKEITFEEYFEREKAYKRFKQMKKKQKELKWKKQVYGDYNPKKRPDEWRDPWRRSKSPHSRRSFSREGSKSSASSGSHKRSPASRSPSYNYPSPTSKGTKRSGEYNHHYGKKRGSPRYSPQPKRMRLNNPSVNFKKQLSPPIKISIKNFSPPNKERSVSPLPRGRHSQSRSLSHSVSRSFSSGSRSPSRSLSASRSTASSRGSTPSPRPKDEVIKRGIKKAIVMDHLSNTSPIPTDSIPLPPSLEEEEEEEEPPKPEEKKVEPVVTFVINSVPPTFLDKQQIKLTLMSKKKNILEPSPLEELSRDKSDEESNNKQSQQIPRRSRNSPSKFTGSRREELLKQLAAVEEAIARKRVPKS